MRSVLLLLSAAAAHDATGAAPTVAARKLCSTAHDAAHHNNATTSLPKVLLFAVLGRNFVKLASATMVKALDLGFSLHLVHFNGSLPVYKRLPWYRRVLWSDISVGSKAQNILRHLIHANRRKAILEAFTHVWVTDEDIRFPQAEEMRRFVMMASAMGALVVGPAMHNTGHPLARPSRGRGVTVRLVDFVEVMSPLMRRDVFVGVWKDHFKAGRSTDYGMDNTWCRWLARTTTAGCKACAIVQLGNYTKIWHAKSSHSYDADVAHSEMKAHIAAHRPDETQCLTYYIGRLDAKLEGDRLLAEATKIRRLRCPSKADLPAASFQLPCYSNGKRVHAFNDVRRRRTLPYLAGIKLFNTTTSTVQHRLRYKTYH
jgi:hypothetical protein